MNAYRCWHYLCRETMQVVLAATSFAARKEMARMLGVDVTDIVSVRCDYE